MFCYKTMANNIDVILLKRGKMRPETAKRYDIVVTFNCLNLSERKTHLVLHLISITPCNHVNAYHSGRICLPVPPEYNAVQLSAI